MAGSGREVVVARRSVVPKAPPTGRAGRPRFQPTEEQRQQVAMMVAHGITNPSIAAILGLDEDTLNKHFATELEHGLAACTSRVAGSMYRKAIMGDVGAGQFWLKSRAKWRDREAPITVNNLGDGDVLIDSKRSMVEEMRARRQAAEAEAAEAVSKAAQTAKGAA